ncbi:unnamed protein product [Rotaria sp. Silwood1]|nr:unnamed protein product [Rotaria sp. Silwood1]
MFSNSVYNFPPQYNENVLTQNLAGLSLNPAQSRQDSQQQRQNADFGTFQFPQPQHHLPIDIGGYVPPSLDEASMKWLSPDDVNVSYQRGSTVVRQYNNSMIDDYYKKYTRPITDYVPIPTNGQPTYVYQNLDGQQVATGTVPIQQSYNQGTKQDDLRRRKTLTPTTCSQIWSFYKIIQYLFAWIKSKRSYRCGLQNLLN